MTMMCAASCNSCELLDPNLRCSEENMGINLTDTLVPGQLGELFTSLAKMPNVEVLHKGEPWGGCLCVCVCLSVVGNSFLNQKGFKNDDIGSAFRIR
jgi:hypothetical protein